MNSDKYSVAESRSIAETSVAESSAAESSAADSRSERSKRENRKALRIFIPVMIAAALVGGLIGGFSSTGTAAGLADSIASYLDRAAYLLSPYLMIASVIVGIVGGCFCYRSARRLFTESEALTDEDAQYEAFSRADDRISQGMVLLGISDVVGLIFFAAMISYLRDYIEILPVLYTVTIVVFIAGSFIRLKQQQLMVDFVKKMNPQKQGSIYDLKFQKKWEESCDEMEKMVIYKASYKAYQTAMKSCATVFLIVMMLSFFFDYGPLPAVATGVIWLVTAISYFREAQKLGREKINNQ